MAKELDWPQFPDFSEAAMGRLLDHSWPGNVRELRNVVERSVARGSPDAVIDAVVIDPFDRSEEHTSELQSLMRISYAVFCLKKKKTEQIHKYKESETLQHRSV